MKTTPQVTIDSYKLKKYLAMNNITGKELADKMGIAPSTVSKIIKNGIISRSQYLAMIQVLGISDQTVLLPNETEKDNANYMSLLSDINSKLDKLEYINKNICELVDVFNVFVEAFK